MDPNMDPVQTSRQKGLADRYIILALVLTGIAMAVIDGIVVSIALPTITAFFSVGIAQSQWIITAYLLTETSLMLIFGKVAEYTGKNRLFIAGFIVFTFSSLACGLAPDMNALILFRVIQAAGAAMLFSISGAIIFEHFPRGEQGRAMGYVGATIAMASIAAPVAGGFLTEALGWESIFLINVPIGIGATLLTLKYFKSEERREPGLDMDWGGAIFLVSFMVCLILFLGELSTETVLDARALLYLALFLVTFALFLIQESRCQDPLLELSVFRNWLFTLPCIAMILIFVAFFMVNLAGPFYFEGVIGLDPSEVGLVFLIAPIIMIAASPFCGWLYDRYQFRYLAVTGTLLAGISMVLLGYAAIGANLSFIVAIFIPFSFGSAMFQSPNNTEIMRALPHEKIGIASSLSATLRNLGMTLGVSFSSIMIVSFLHAGGYSGSITEAEPALLAVTTSKIMFIGAGLCFAAAVVCLVRALLQRKGEDTSLPGYEDG